MQQISAEAKSYENSKMTSAIVREITVIWTDLEILEALFDIYQSLYIIVKIYRNKVLVNSNNI